MSDVNVVRALDVIDNLCIELKHIENLLEILCMHNICDYRDSRLYSLAQQEEYLNILNDEQLEEISKQINMHKFAKCLYKDYH